MFEDFTAVWHQFTEERDRQFVAARDQFVDLYGPASYSLMADFYSTVPRMFAGGRLGGARITASKPGNTKLARGRAEVWEGQAGGMGQAIDGV